MDNSRTNQLAVGQVADWSKRHQIFLVTTRIHSTEYTTDMGWRTLPALLPVSVQIYVAQVKICPKNKFLHD